MIAHDLLAELDQRGITIEAHGGRLRYSPRSAVTPDLLQRLMLYKGELLAIMTNAVDLGRCGQCREPLVGLRTFDGYLNRFCKRCGAWHRCLGKGQY